MRSFCEVCGERLEHVVLEGRTRDKCPSCERVHYDQPKVGAGTLIVQDGRLLLLRRAIEPYLGCWNLPAGYAEVDEAPGETAVRETLEETGLEVELGALINVYFFTDDPRGNGLLILYAANIIGGTLRGSSETAIPTFFSVHDLPKNIGGGGHDVAVRDWQESMAKATSP